MASRSTTRPFHSLTIPLTHRCSPLPTHKRLSSSTTTPPAHKKTAHLECERKFTITPHLHTHLSQNTPIQTLHFHQPSPTQTFQDTYFDIHDEFLARGIWLRYRTPTPHIPDSSPGTWEAKLRSTIISEETTTTDTEYINSKFEEVSGARECHAAIRERFPRFSFLALILLGYGHVTAMISTRREVWVGRDTMGSRDTAGLKIVLDEMVAVPQTEVEGEFPLRHGVGEVEVTKTVVLGEDVGGNERMKVEELAGMDLMIQEFMEDQSLFPTVPAPVGKLSAYFEWKKTTIEPEELKREIAKALAMGRRMRE